MGGVPVKRGPGRPARIGEQQILTTAEAIIDHLGWDALTMTELAQQLGVKVPSLYNHIENLEMLQHQLRCRFVGQIGDALCAVLPASGVTESIFRLAIAYRSYAHEHPGRYQAITVGDRVDDPDLAEAGVYAGSALRSVLATAGLDVPEMEFWQLALWAAVHGFVSLELSGALRTPPESRERMFARFVSDLVGRIAVSPARAAGGF
jgi:AcrR family transcriptional regulator